MDRLLTQSINFAFSLQPVVYLEEHDSSVAKDWVKNPNDRDMITDYEVVNGFEHDVVIIVQKLDQNTFEHNMVMRSIALPIIVKIPIQPLKG